jgi:tetratricopeptide (TPR) repeat protein
LIFKRFSLYQDSILYFKKCLESSLKNESNLQLGHCYSKLNQTCEALSIFTKSHKEQSSSYSALSLGWFLKDSDQKSSHQHLTEGLSLCTKGSLEELDLLYALARLHHLNKDFPQASNFYLQVLNQNSSDFQALNSFGILCSDIGQTAQAFRCFTRASELSGKSWEIWNNIGSLYWISGQHNESKIAFDKAKQLAKNQDFVKERTKEMVFFEFDVSEIPFLKRREVKEEKIEKPKPQNNGIGLSYQQNVMNGYAAIGWYLNMAKQFSAIHMARQRFEEDKKAAEILTDLSTVVPKKRKRDTNDEENPKNP